MERIILHSDANAFYASCECLYRPEIRDPPVTVCGNPETRHGIIRGYTRKMVRSEMLTEPLFEETAYRTRERLGKGKAKPVSFEEMNDIVNRMACCVCESQICS